jgi:hypothetical protein
MDDEDVLTAAEAALREGRAGEAQRLLHGVVERNPGNGRAWYLLSVLTTIDSQREMYLAKALTAGFDPAPPPPPAVVEQPPAEDEPEKDEVILAARAALAEERMGEVRRLLMPLVERDPQHGEAWFLLSQASSLDSQRLLYWQKAWDAGHKHLLPAARTSSRPAQPTGPRYRAPLDEPLPLFAHERQHQQPYYPPPPGQSRSAPDDSPGVAFVKGGCYLVLAFAILGACALFTGGFASINLGGIACLFVIGGVLGVMIQSVRGR